MTRWLILLCLLALCAGCASDNHSEMDDLWRQGYGYNNPNYDRIRTGQKSVGF